MLSKLTVNNCLFRAAFICRRLKSIERIIYGSVVIVLLDISLCTGLLSILLWECFCNPKNSTTGLCLLVLPSSEVTLRSLQLLRSARLTVNSKGHDVRCSNFHSYTNLAKTSLYSVKISFSTVTSDMFTLLTTYTVIRPIFIHVVPESRGCWDPFTILKLSRCWHR